MSRWALLDNFKDEASQHEQHARVENVVVKGETTKEKFPKAKRKKFFSRKIIKAALIARNNSCKLQAN